MISRSFLPGGSAGPEQIFFSDWAKVYTGVERGSGQCFFAEEVESFLMQRTSFEQRPLFLVTVRFKSWGFGRRGSVTFAVVAEGEKELLPLENWLRANQVSVSRELPEDNQRRS
jgi:hypothetical protein